MPSITPKRLATQIRTRLREAGDEQTAARGRSYFKRDDDVQLYGVKSSVLRGIEKEAYGLVRADWTVVDAISFCELTADVVQFEAKMVGVLLLGRYHKDFPKGLLARVRGWILDGLFCNWAAIDGLAPTVITPLIVKYGDLMPRVVCWTSSGNLWLRRAAAVAFVPLARKGRELDSAYAVVEHLLSDANDLIHKASGWLLREAGRTDMHRLERFLLDNGPHIPRTTVRYAIERFPGRRRKRLLVETRG
ncbi:MAG: DNA alkylation repair protein [Gemmatimonadota bacterium]|nr:MAG: DNA alkylation repair protein [Gemmatimonadota bacterium]